MNDCASQTSNGIPPAKSHVLCRQLLQALQFPCQGLHGCRLLLQELHHESNNNHNNHKHDDNDKDKDNDNNNNNNIIIIIIIITIAISIDIPIAIINIINIIIKKHHHEHTKETNNFHQQATRVGSLDTNIDKQQKTTTNTTTCFNSCNSSKRTSCYTSEFYGKSNIYTSRGKNIGPMEKEHNFRKHIARGCGYVQYRKTSKNPQNKKK